MQAQAVEWGGGEVKNWKLAPELTIVSGVRDEPFRMDPDLSFTKAPTGRGDTWPLEFLVQDTAAGERATPWSFPEVAPRLRPAVSRLMFENRMHDRSLRECVSSRYCSGFSGLDLRVSWEMTSRLPKSPPSPPQHVTTHRTRSTPCGGCRLQPVLLPRCARGCSPSTDGGANGT